MNNSIQKHNKVLCFKRWGNKAWSAFMSMGKPVQIATLSVAYLTVSGQGFAQENNQENVQTTQDIELGELEVTAEFSPQLQSEAARVVSVITKSEIQAAAAQSVNELLEFALGVDIRQRGSQGIQADVSVRGGTFDQVMFLLNGVNVTDPQTGHFNLNIPVEITSIERIEILEGPGARYWGPNAFTGAINIVTKNVKGNEATVHVAGGDFGYVNANVDVSFKNGNSQNYLNVGLRKSDGYIANADYEMFNLYFNQTKSFKGGRSTFQLGLNDKTFGANTFYTPRFPYQGEHNRTAFGAYKVDVEGYNFRISPSAYVRLNQDRFELYREKGYFEKTSDGFRVMDADTVPGWYGGHNYHITATMGTDLNGKFYSDLGTSSLGVSVRRASVLSNVLGESMKYTRPAFMEPDGLYTKSSVRVNTSAFAEHFYSYDGFTASLGIMANKNTAIGDDVDYYWGADVAYQLSQSSKAYGSYTTSFRMPTFTDLYYNGPQNVGNPNLKAETAETIELGLKYKQNGFAGHIAGYYRKGTNLIDWVKEANDNGKYTTINHNGAQTTGIEMAARWNPRAQFGKDFFVTNVTSNYSFIDKEIDLKGKQSAYVGDYLKHKFTTRASFRVMDNLEVHLGIRYQDRAGEYDKFENGTTTSTAYEAFWLSEFKLTYTKGAYQVYTEISNLMDKTYVDFGNVHQPGRWAITGIKVFLK